MTEVQLLDRWNRRDDLYRRSRWRLSDNEVIAVRIWRLREAVGHLRATREAAVWVQSGHGK